MLISYNINLVIASLRISYHCFLSSYSNSSRQNTQLAANLTLSHIFTYAFLRLSIASCSHFGVNSPIFHSNNQVAIPADNNSLSISGIICLRLLVFRIFHDSLSACNILFLSKSAFVSTLIIAFQIFNNNSSHNSEVSETTHSTHLISKSSLNKNDLFSIV